MNVEKIRAMLIASAGANHVGEFPVGEYCPMQNHVRSIHAISDLLEIFHLKQKLEVANSLLKLSPEILTGKQARKKYTLAQLKKRNAVIITRFGFDNCEMGAGPIVDGRDGQIALFVKIGSADDDVLGVFDNEQFALLPELSTVSVDKGGAA